MSTTITTINDNKFSIRFVTSQFTSLTSAFSDSSISDWPAIRMCIRRFIGPKRTKLAVFLFYGAHGSGQYNADVTAVLNLKRANGTTGERITMHNIYYLESYAYGFACFLDVLQLKSQGYIEENQIILESIVTIDPEVQQKKIHNFEINDPVLGDAVFHVDGKKFYAHKDFLSLRSKLFDSTTDDNNCIGLILNDVKHEEFEQFLQCMYSATNIDNNNLESVYKLANRYSADLLIYECEKFHSLNADINKPAKLEYIETCDLSNSSLGLFDCTKDNTKRRLTVDIPRNFDETTIVALLNRMQEAIKFAVKPKKIQNFEIKDPVLGDAVLIVDGKKMYVNKGFLSTHSSVFKSLFAPNNYNYDYGYGQITEHNIDGVKYDDFEQFLQCIYSTQNVDNSNVISVLGLARRCSVQVLMDQCEKFLISSADINKSIKLEYSETYKLSKLQAVVLDSIKDITELKTLLPSMSRALLNKLSKMPEYLFKIGIEHG